MYYKNKHVVKHKLANKKNSSLGDQATEKLSKN